MNLMLLTEIVGKKIIAVKGITPSDKRRTKQPIPLEFILLDDGETIISFEEQDYYSYHDCSPSARLVHVYKDSSQWIYIKNDPRFVDCTVSAQFPFIL